MVGYISTRSGVPASFATNLPHIRSAMLFTQSLCITMRTLVIKIAQSNMSGKSGHGTRVSIVTALMYPPKWFDAYIPEQSIIEDTSLGAHF